MTVARIAIAAGVEKRVRSFRMGATVSLSRLPAKGIFRRYLRAEFHASTETTKASLPRARKRRRASYLGILSISGLVEPR
jgi:hypothetical protein